MQQRLILLVISMIFTGCVTTTEGPFKPKASREEVVKSYVELGLGYLQKADYDGARRSLKRGLELDPKSPDVHHAMGLMFQLQGENTLAEKSFTTALSYAPRSAQFNNNYGSFLYDQGRFDAAYRALLVAAEDTLYVNRGQVFENLGRCALRLQKISLARDYFEKAMKINPKQNRAMLELARLESTQGKVDLANSYYEAYLKILKAGQVPPSASDLLTGIEIAKKMQEMDKMHAYGLVLGKLYPNSSEYKQYQETYQ